METYARVTVRTIYAPCASQARDGKATNQIFIYVNHNTRRSIRCLNSPRVVPSRASHFAVGRLLCRPARWRTFHCSLPIFNRHSIVAVCHALHDVYLSTVKKITSRSLNSRRASRCHASMLNIYCGLVVMLLVVPSDSLNVRN